MGICLTITTFRSLGREDFYSQKVRLFNKLDISLSNKYEIIGYWWETTNKHDQTTL